MSEADWPHFSGSRYYPVPHTQEELQEMRSLFPKWQYKTCWQIMYNGRSRRELALYIARNL